MMEVATAKETCKCNGLIFSICLPLYGLFLLPFMLNNYNLPKTILSLYLKSKRVADHSAVLWVLNLRVGLVSVVSCFFSTFFTYLYMRLILGSAWMDVYPRATCPFPHGRRTAASSGHFRLYLSRESRRVRALRRSLLW